MNRCGSPVQGLQMCAQLCLLSRVKEQSVNEVDEVREQLVVPLVLVAVDLTVASLRFG